MRGRPSPAAERTGRVLYGINNIYTVEADGRRLECRIKGKVLKGEERTYNPIAAGDRVRLMEDPISVHSGWIVERLPRDTVLARWNRKRQGLQILAANAEVLACVSSAQSPPFRARFLDRLLVSAKIGDLEPVIVLNKVDLGVEPGTEERILDYVRCGYRVIPCSARTGAGVDEVARLVRERLCLFVGQSGVGKSSLLNLLDPALGLKVGEVSAKYDRGAHTTTNAALMRLSDGVEVIDTPGVREFEVAGIEPRDLHHYFVDLARFSPECAYTPCLHLDEPGCAVKEAVEAGDIHPDRYESYVRLYEDMNEWDKTAYGFTRD